MAVSRRSRSSRRIGLLVLGLLGLVAWRLETPWRRIQAEYLDAVLEASRAELAVLRAESAEDLRFLEGEVEVARDRLPPREITDFERTLLVLERRLLRAGPGREAEGLEELVLAERRKLDGMLSDLRAAQTRLADARRPIERLEVRVESLAGFAGWLRRVPALRALGAGVGLREVRPTGTARVERCVTCHLSMAPGAEPPSMPTLDEETGRLFAPHPAADLHLAADSPHPLDDFGCTACHGGDGTATEFAGAGHRPPDSAMATRSPRPILAGARVESSCVACHDVPWLPSAPTQEAGRLLARSMACGACHETGRGDLVPTVPSLVDLPLRKRRTWVAAFLADPSSWRPTFMPHFWDDAEPAERDAEIAAIVAWLFRSEGRSEGRSETQPNERSAGTARGEKADTLDDSASVKEGQRLWRNVGCIACHLVEPMGREELLGSQRLRGPSLARIGAEARAGALPDLLRGHDPRYAWRAGEVEALSAFLSGLVGEGDASGSDPGEISPDVRDELLRRRLLEVTTHEDAAAWLDRLSGEARTLLLGRLAVRRYRCGSCHVLAESSPVGPAVLPLDLPTASEASSLVEVGERFRGPATALWPSAEDVGAWPHADAQERGLPSWRLDPREAEALAVQLAGWREAPVDEEARSGSMSGPDVMARHGCRACHALTVDDDLAGVFGRRAAPPSLARAGEKLRSDWIFLHLGDPEAMALRPWASLRMPGFDLQPAERSAVAEYFARRADVPVLSPDIGLPSASERALGEAVYRVLLCDSCHRDDAALRAPDYRVAGRRLRAQWLREWLLEPHEGAGMPTPFPSRDGRPDATYLLATLDAPMFEVHRVRLERFFPDRDELERVFHDPAAVADALALHVLTLAEQ